MRRLSPEVKAENVRLYWAQRSAREAASRGKKLAYARARVERAEQDLETARRWLAEAKRDLAKLERGPHAS
jgi:hypothetical protein